MPKLFRGDVTIHATAYVVAETADEAREILATMPNSAIEVDCGYVGEDIEITGEQFSVNMPELSLSPAMSIGVCELEDEEGEELPDEEDDEA